MTFSEDIIKGLEEELERKIRDREGILDRLSLVDIELDKYDDIIKGIDADAYQYIPAINAAVNSVDSAYEARLSAGCVTNLIWEKQQSWTVFLIDSGSSTFESWKVVLNGGPPEDGHGSGSGTYGYTPYHGIKYYSKPSNRDYGANLVGEFEGFVTGVGATIIGFTTSQFEDSAFSEASVPSEFTNGLTVTDNLVNPDLFTVGDLPEITGTGTTTIVAVTTSLIGGISTGSNIFYHFGAGDIGLATTGMAILEPEDNPNISTVFGSISNQFVTIVGFGTADYDIEYYDSLGILTTSTLAVNTILLSDNATEGVEDATFNIGIITSAPAIFLSTSTLAGTSGTTFYVLSTDAEIDANFDYLANPNSPVKIGTLNSGNFGIGHSVFYDDSGDPAETKNWRPEKDRPEIKIKGANNLKEKKQPYVGAGRAEYWIGTTQWPTLTKTTATTNPGTGFTTYSTSTTYPAKGTQVTIGGTQSTASIGYANVGPNTPGNCSSFNSSISSAESNLNAVISENKPKAQGILAQSATLRKRREKLELFAWSLLQSAAKTREEIEELRAQISSLKNTDFSKYEK
jgi:hypothetical protein